MLKSYKKGGSAGRKGTDYEIRLALHFMVRAILNDYHSFALACNIDAGGKFDDVVLRYQRNENDPVKLRLVQAKNKIGPSIGKQELLDMRGGDFDLLKYFSSYQSITSGKSELKDVEIEDVILFTVRDIEIACNELALKSITEKDDIIHFPGSSATRFKLQLDDKTIERMKEEHAFVRLAQSLKEHMTSKKPIRLDVFEDSHLALSDYVFDVTDTTAKFKPTFLDGSHPEFQKPNGIKFRQVLLSEFRGVTDGQIKVFTGFGKKQLKLNKENRLAEAEEIVGEIMRCISTGDELDHHRGIISKFHRALVDENIVDMENNKIHANFLKMKINTDKDANSLKDVALMKKIFGDYCKRNQYRDIATKISEDDYSLQFPEDFGKSQLPGSKHIRCTLFPEFIEQLTLAVNQPDEEKLKEFIKQDLSVILPFSRESDDIYGRLETKMSDWYKHPNGEWLTMKTALEWLAEAGKQHSALVNPLENKNADFENINWGDLKEEARAHILEKKLKFQGEIMSVKELIDCETAKAIMKKGVIDFLLRSDKEITIGTSIAKSTGYDERYYIPRAIQWPILKDQKPKRKERNEGVSITYSIKDFDAKEGNVLYVERESNIILKFKGQREALTDYIDDQNSKSFSDERDWLQKIGNAAIISDTAGMGKSTILTNFYHILKTLPNVWVLRCDLNHAHVKTAIDKYHKSENNAMAFLKHFAHLENEFAVELFRHRASNNGLVIMFDGFDEIGEGHQSTFKEILEKLKKNIRQLWISTRPNMKMELENALGVVAFSLLSFTQSDQEGFLVRYWESSDQGRDLTDEKRKDFAKELLKLLKEQIRDSEREFTGIPLQCKLLAESFAGERELPKRLNLTILYNRFWKKKLKIYFDKNPRSDDDDKPILGESDLKASLQKLALKQLFPDRTELGKELEEKSVCDDAWGLTVDCGKSFIHQTFAEYFASLYFCEKLNEHSVLNYVIETIFNESRHKVIRCFLNGLIQSLLQEKKWKEMRTHNIFKVKENLLVASEEGNEHIASLIFCNLEIIRSENEPLDPPALICAERQGWKPLHFASNEGHEIIVEMILNFGKNKIDPNTLFLSKKDGRTPLHLASQRGHEKAVSKILNFAAENGPHDFGPQIVTSKDEKGWSPLHLSSKNGHEEVVKTIIHFAQQCNIDANELFQQGGKGDKAALHLASEKGHKKVVEALLNSAIENKVKFSLLFRGDDENRNPLHYASAQGHDKIVDQLLTFISENRNRIDPEIVSVAGKNGWTPLHYASRGGYDKIVQMILKFAADNCLDPEILFAAKSDGWTPLHLAVVNDNENIVGLILEFANANRLNGSRFFIGEGNGWTPLHFAAKKGYEKIAEMILNFAKGNQIKSNLVFSEKNDGWTPLHLALANGNDKIVEMIQQFDTEHESSPIHMNADKDGKTPLHGASANGHVKMIELIIKFMKKGKIDLDRLLDVDKNKKTPLHFASKNGHDLIVGMILQFAFENGIAFDVLFVGNKDDWTPLHYASTKGHASVLQWILIFAEQCQFNLERLFVAEKDGWTPIHFASRAGHEQFLEIILKFSSEKGIDPNILFAKKNDGWTPLHLAAENGQEKSADMLLSFARDKGIHKDILFVREKDGNMPLHLASKEGYEKIVEIILKFVEANQINPKIILQVDKDYWNPLHFASAKGKEDIVEMFLNFASENGIDPKLLFAAEKDGWNALHFASARGHDKVVETILRFAAANAINPNILFVAEKDGWTPLHFASKRGYEKVVDSILKFARDNKIDQRVIFAAKDDGWTPLHLAAANDQDKVVEMILENDYNDLFVKEKEGWTPFHIAAKEGHEKVIEIILNVAKKLGYQMALKILLLKGKDDLTPLHLSSNKGHHEVAKMILKFAKTSNMLPSTILAEAKEGWTPLHFACKKDHEEVVDMILKFARDCNIHPNQLLVAKKDGWTPLHLAASNGHKEVVELIMDYAIEKKCPDDILFRKDNDDRTPLHMASDDNHVRVVKMILKFATGNQMESDILLVTDKNSWSPLHFASKKGHGKVVKQILKFARKKNINVSTLLVGEKNGWTPLHLACKKGHEEVVRLILKCVTKSESPKVDPNIVFAVKNDGWTPLQLASANGHNKIVEIIQKFASDNGIDPELVKVEQCGGDDKDKLRELFRKLLSSASDDAQPSSSSSTREEILDRILKSAEDRTRTPSSSKSSHEEILDKLLKLVTDEAQAESGSARAGIQKLAAMLALKETLDKIRETGTEGKGSDSCSLS